MNLKMKLKESKKKRKILLMKWKKLLMLINKRKINYLKKLLTFLEFFLKLKNIYQFAIILNEKKKKIKRLKEEKDNLNTNISLEGKKGGEGKFYNRLVYFF